MSNAISASNHAKIRRLNDQLRCNGLGNGSFMATKGITTRPNGFAARAFEAMREFNHFTKDNDPHGEHEFGAFTFEGERLFWKIDYYAPDMQRGSDDPTDEKQTHRVLTLMLASEY